MVDTVSDHEIRSSLAEIQFRFPKAGPLLKAARQGRLSLRDAIYFAFLESLEEQKQTIATSSPIKG